MASFVRTPPAAICSIPPKGLKCPQKVRQKTFGIYCMTTVEEKLEAVKLGLSGKAPYAIGQALGFDEHDVSEWIERYRLYGIQGLEKQRYRRYTFEEKCKIICEYRKKHLPLHIFSAQVRISQTRIREWNSIVKAQGYEGLRLIGRHGRPPKQYDMGRPKKREPQTEQEKLIRELEYLRAENAYLKKLRALMIEKESQKRKRES